MPKLGGKRVPSTPTSTGCLICGLDENPQSTLLCESCDGEYHTYCLQPPLDKVPEGVWRCPKCTKKKPRKKRKPKQHAENLEELVKSLPKTYTNLFGTVVWAQGGPNYGWWPSIVYDPRRAVEPARSEARKHLGRLHLVYFFQCPQSPFSILPLGKIKLWEEGLVEDFFHGRTAKSAGKARHTAFQEALQVAVLEQEKPVRDRLEWVHTADSPGSSPLRSPARKRKRSPSVETAAVAEVVCKVVYVDTTTRGANKSVGFVVLPSQETSTYGNIREKMDQDLCDDLPADWKFYLPATDAPVARRQESSLGPVYKFLKRASDTPVGKGTYKDPLVVHVTQA